MSKLNEITKDYCPRCQLLTNHKCLFEKGIHSSHDDDFHWSEYFDIIQCLGCENIQFRTRNSNEDMFHHDPYTGEQEYYEDVKYYPLNLMNHNILKNSYYLPNKIRVVYIETIEALKNNCYLLSGVGLRAVIEAVCIEQSITGRNLEVKINNLVKNKLITEKDANRLHSIRFLGNDSVHEMDVPNEAKLRAAIEIVEHMLKNLYLIDIEASEHLDTIISNYDDFKALFLRKYRNTTFAVGDEKNIKEVLQKDFRRIESTYLANFTQQLIDEINNGIITSLSIGKLDNNIQYFIKN